MLTIGDPLSDTAVPLPPMDEEQAVVELTEATALLAIVNDVVPRKYRTIAGVLSCFRSTVTVVAVAVTPLARLALSAKSNPLFLASAFAALTALLPPAAISSAPE